MACLSQVIESTQVEADKLQMSKLFLSCHCCPPISFVDMQVLCFEGHRMTTANIAHDPRRSRSLASENANSRVDSLCCLEMTQLN